MVTFDIINFSKSGVFIFSIFKSGVFRTMDGSAALFLPASLLLFVAAFRSSDSGRLRLVVDCDCVDVAIIYWSLPS